MTAVKREKARETCAEDSSPRTGKRKPASDVRLVLKLFFALSLVTCFQNGNAENQHERESRKLFGGYRITPSYCKATRASRYNRGSTVCMFNHECVQRGGEVVGACVDGFLFGACCQLPEDKQPHYPKGPGIVMTSYLDYPEAEAEEEIDDSDSLTNWHNSFKPVIKPGYKPTEKYDGVWTKYTNEVRTTNQEASTPTVQVSNESINSEFSEGLSQITNSLLNSPEKDSNIVYIRPGAHEKPAYTYSTISHEGPDTILLHKNGSEVDNIARPSDFNIQISSMQTKPTPSPNFMSSTPSTTIQTVFTHRPVFSKPIFKPKPGGKPNKPSLVTKAPVQKPKPESTTEKYIQVATVSQKTPASVQSSSIDSIIQMLNESTPSVDQVENTTQAVPVTAFDAAETKSSPAPVTVSVTPVSFTSGYPNYQYSTGHYVTKPSNNFVHSSTLIMQQSTEKVPLPQYTQTSKPVYVTNKYSTSANSIPDEDRITTISYVSSSKPSTYFTTFRPTYQPSTYYESSWSTNRPTNPSTYDNFNKYSTVYDEVAEDDRITTISYVSTTTQKPPTTTRKPPSTSYVFGSKPSKRPIISSATSNLLSSYDIAPETFSSVTPTVIVLSGFQTPKPETQQHIPTQDVSEGESGFVEISQEPFKKPMNQLTINNYISSTHNIHVGKPPADKLPSSTVVITPKPTPSPTENRLPTKPSLTTPIIHTSTGFNVIRPSTSAPIRYTTGVPTTFRPEQQTSPDDLINFPPVRNPMLNASGSNPGLYNTSVAVSDDDLILQEVEFTTPSFLQEDEVLNEKMNLFVNKIVGSLQGTFQELHDIVILDKKQNVTVTKPGVKVTTVKPVRKPGVTTRRPAVTTKKPPVRATTTTRRPTKKPTRVTVTTKKPLATTTQAPTTTKKAVTTTKKPRPTKRVTTTTQTPSTTTIQYDEVTTEQYGSTTVDYSNKQLCGVRPLVKTGRIVGGKGATFGEWPWQVLVRESTWLGLFTKNKCGGVLITSKYVTTAAHCQPGFLASLVAVFGEHDISGDLEAKRPVSRNVRRVIVHRLYDAATFENDLALLELDSPIHFDAHIVPICMPPDEADFTGRMATVTGWGRLKYGGGVPAVLQEVQVPVIENSVCQEMFQTAGHTKIILGSFMCAGYANGQKDSCEGDSGGPLVLQRPDGRWQLVGTVSHGIKCAAPYLPGVYMRTTFYKPWLKSITGVH